MRNQLFGFFQTKKESLLNEIVYNQGREHDQGNIGP